MKKLSEFTDRQRQINQEADGLTAEDLNNLETMRTIATQFVEALHVIGQTDASGEQLASRHLALARNHIEDALNRVVMHVRGGKGNGMP